MFLWCVRDGWSDIYSERGLLLISSSRGQGVSSLATPCMLVRDTSDRLHVPCSTAILCTLFNLTTWFSSGGLLPVTYLLYPTALIVLSSSRLRIKMWQLAKAHGVTRNEPKIHVIFYITKYWVYFHVHYFPDHTDPEWQYVLGFNLLA